MPKVELHCHLDGSLRPATMLDLAHEQRVKLPADSLESLTDYMRADDVTDLDAYLARFEATISVLQTPEAIERTSYELGLDAHADGVRYIEVRNAPHLNTRAGMTPDQVVEATLRGLARAERETGTVARFIVCSLKHWDPSVSVDAAQVAVRHKDAGVVGFDMAGPEVGFDSSAHAAAFQYARTHFLGVTCHAGEAAGPESVKDALFGCNANRIGHGVRAGEDPALLDYIRDRRIPLELCPTSNEQTHAVERFADHPIKRFLDDGVMVTINTDNRLVSGLTLTDEFARLRNELGFDTADLARCVLNGCEASFLAYPERVKLIDSVRAELERDWGLRS